MPADIRKIVWLASYPKSGNTWFRIFLSNLMSKSDVPVNINELNGGTIASSRQLFDEATGLSSADLTQEEIENLRPEVYRYLATQSQDLTFHKIHDAYTLVSGNVPLVPADVTHCALYFIRNPLDVAVSFAHHSNLPCQKIIDQMNDDTFAFCSRTDKLHNQLNQKLLSWSNHIRSWVDLSGLPLQVIRFEDMKNEPLKIFKAAIDFIGLNYSEDAIAKAIQFSDFKIIKEQEIKHGFKEKPLKSSSFFRKGEIGSGMNELSKEEIDSVINHHQIMMRRFGYL
jgi:hypothetical protein